jgi:hypothetical protein
MKKKGIRVPGIGHRYSTCILDIVTQYKSYSDTIQVLAPKNVSAR